MDKFINLDRCNKVLQLLHESRSCTGLIKTVYRECILVTVDYYEHFIFPISKQVELMILEENELFLCKSTVLGIKNNEEYINLVLSPPKIIRLINRRMYHRIPINLKVSYLPLATSIHYYSISDIPTEILARSNLKEGIITDIGGGGLKLQCSDDLEIESQIVVCMNVNFRLSLLSKITRKEAVKKGEETIYIYGIYFDIITEKEREKIIDFIFENEIYLRTKIRKNGTE